MLLILMSAQKTCRLSRRPVVCRRNLQSVTKKTYVGAVAGPNNETAIEHEFHVASSRSPAHN